MILINFGSWQISLNKKQLARFAKIVEYLILNFNKL